MVFTRLYFFFTLISKVFNPFFKLINFTKFPSLSVNTASSFILNSDPGWVFPTTSITVSLVIIFWFGWYISKSGATTIFLKYNIRYRKQAKTAKITIVFLTNLGNIMNFLLFNIFLENGFSFKYSNSSCFRKSSILLGGILRKLAYFFK